MKKVIILLSCIVLSLSAVVAQNQKPKPTDPKSKTPTGQATQGQTITNPPPANIIGDHFAKKYSIASRWNDLDAAKDALYDLIIEYPGSDSLIFALAYYYYENQKLPSSVLICQDLLARNPKNLQALELSGISYEGLNVFDRALQNYESLFLLTNNNTTLYKMAFLQYELKKYQECLTNVDILLTKPEADTVKMIFNDKEKKPKEYPMRVALLNLKGMVYKDQSDKVNAKKSFEDALKIAPDFLFAKENLDALK